MTKFDSGIKDYFGENFTDMDLSNREILHTEFDGCTFDSCDFSEAMFRKCILTDCRFVKCNLSVAKIDYSKFQGVSFEDCKVIGVDWTKGHWPGFALASPIGFKRCLIDASSFYGMNLKDILIEECRAHDVDFREADLSYSNFSHTDLSNSLFANTNLGNANFFEASNYTIDVHHNELRQAKFCRQEALSLLESLGIELID